MIFENRTLNEKRNKLRKENQVNIFKNKENLERRKKEFLRKIDLKIKELKEAKKSVKKIRWLKKNEIISK